MDEIALQFANETFIHVSLKLEEMTVVILAAVVESFAIAALKSLRTPWEALCP